MIDYSGRSAAFILGLEENGYGHVRSLVGHAESNVINYG